MSFERYGHQWEDGALDMIPGDGDNVGFIGQNRTWVVNNLQGVPVSIHATVCLGVDVESGIDLIDEKIAVIAAQVARLQEQITKLEARKAEILGA